MAACPFCRREIQLTNAGRFRHHNWPKFTRRLCTGSTHTEVSAAVAAKRDPNYYASGEASGNQL
jgi:hypothetical protein